MIPQSWLDEAQQTGEPDAYIGKRQHVRFSWHADLEVRETSGPGEGLRRPAAARNLSDGGMGFFCVFPFEPSTAIEVSVVGEETGVPAVVRHCTKSGKGYLVGAEFMH